VLDSAYATCLPARRGSENGQLKIRLRWDDTRVDEAVIEAFGRWVARAEVRLVSARSLGEGWILTNHRCGDSSSSRLLCRYLTIQNGTSFVS